MDYEKILTALEAEFNAVMRDSETTLSVGEHLTAAERLLNLYKRMADVQLEFLRENGGEYEGEGSMEIIRQAAEMHTAIAAVKAGG